MRDETRRSGTRLHGPMPARLSIRRRSAIKYSFHLLDRTNGMGTGPSNSRLCAYPPRACAILNEHPICISGEDSSNWAMLEGLRKIRLVFIRIFGSFAYSTMLVVDSSFRSIHARLFCLDGGYGI